MLRRFWAFDKWDEQDKQVVPPLLIYTDLIRTAGLIIWPPDFVIEMSTVGFREAYANSIDVRLADDLVVKVD